LEPAPGPPTASDPRSEAALAIQVRRRNYRRWWRLIDKLFAMLNVLAFSVLGYAGVYASFTVFRWFASDLLLRNETMRIVFDWAEFGLGFMALIAYFVQEIVSTYYQTKELIGLHREQGPR
jgi:hypothetical protein